MQWRRDRPSTATWVTDAPADDDVDPVGSRGGRVGPVSADHAPVPAQQRLRLHQEHRPARPWEQPAQRRQQRTVTGLQVRPWMLAAQVASSWRHTRISLSLALRRPKAKQDQLKDAGPGRRTDRTTRDLHQRRQAATAHRSPSSSGTRWPRPRPTSGTHASERFTCSVAATCLGCGVPW
jgi:hypothetical protein